MKRCVRILALLLGMALLFLTACSGKQNRTQIKKVNLDPKNPVSITVWHYYNGDQQKAFDSLVTEFNETTGREMGIIVQGYSQGSVTDLENNVLDAANKKVGASKIPNIFAAYADTAYAVDQLGLAADLSEEELAEYIDGYIEEGRFSETGGLKIFPIAKSTEIFMINQTDWEKFAAATGASTDAFATFEGITQTAAAYYEWTDSLTSTPNDGKAFFGRDALANFFIVGCRQQGIEIFGNENGKPVLHFDQEAIRKIWDNYYVPYISGYFAANGKFRSDDVKTGGVISFVGSSSGATFFPEEVLLSDMQSYPIQMQVYPCPKFAGGEDFAVQQGAGMVVTKGSEEEIYASTVFLKWFTEKQRNIRFALDSGYLPVTKAANEKAFVEEQMAELDASTKIREIVGVAIDTVNANTLYTTKAFENGTDARSILENSLADKATADRAEVIALIEGGMTHEQAVAQFDTPENFQQWYDQTKAQLEALM